MTFIVISEPRSGSSMLSKILFDSGIKPYISDNSYLLGKSEKNQNGYFEDVKLLLLNDQLIRLFCGYEYSMLYPPDIEKIKSIDFNNNIIKDFSYDYDEETVLMPYDYQKKMQQYTGSDWDIWGLTRMKKNEKWYKCYSKFSVSTYREIINSFHQLETFFNNDKNHDYFTKDPRYSLTSIFFNQTNLKYIYINRNDNSKKKSMRDHYGKELFTRNTIKGCSYVSNHFNYKAKYISYNNFKRNYQKILNKIPTNKIIKISYENLINKDNSEINKLENFVNKKIITSSILS